MRFTGDPAGDRLISTDPLALLIGMLLDQQVSIAWAFRGPATLSHRLGGLDAFAIAEMAVGDFVEVCVAKPAIHRFPAAMGRRIHAVCTHVVERYVGDAGMIWAGLKDAETLRRRLVDLPGFGDEKVMIFVALLAKRLGVRPTGWEEVAGPFADHEPRSVADIDTPEALDRVRAWKKIQRDLGKSKQH